MPPKDWIKRKKIGFRLIELKLDIFSVKCFDYRVSQSPNSWDWRHETFGLKILWKQLLLGLWMIVLHLPSEDELFWGGVQKQVVILYSIGRWTNGWLHQIFFLWSQFILLGPATFILFFEATPLCLIYWFWSLKTLNANCHLFTNRGS